MGGFISLDRRLLDWEWHDEPLTGWLWVNLLLMANHQDKKWHGITVKRGQLVTTYPKLSEQTGLTEWQVRKRLADLTKCGCIETKATHKYTMITICKYDSYQQREGYKPQTDHTQTTLNPQTDHTQTTTNNNDNNIYIVDDDIARTHASAWEKLTMNDLWLDDIQRSISGRFNVIPTQREIEQELESFKAYQIASRLKYEDYMVKPHFLNWLFKHKQQEQQNNGTTNRTVSRDEQRTEEQRKRLQGYADVIRAMREDSGEVQYERPFD